jgi:hypothetical protein
MEPFTMETRSVAAMRQTGLDLTFGRTTFNVGIPDVRTASDIQNFGVCESFTNLSYHNDVSV